MPIPWRSCASHAPFPSARASPVPLCLTLQVDEHAEKLLERACHGDSQVTEAPFALEPTNGGWPDRSLAAPDAHPPEGEFPAIEPDLR